MDKRVDTILNNLEEMITGSYNIKNIKGNQNDSIDAINTKVIQLANQLRSFSTSSSRYDEIITTKIEAIKKIEEYRFAIDQSSIVAYTDLKGTIVYVNDLFCKISKYSREELLGQNQSIVNSGHHPKSFWKEMWQTIGFGEVWKGKIKNKAKDGTYYWVYTTIIPIKNETNKPYKYLAIRHDITELVEAEELVLKSTTDALEEKKVLLKEIHHRVKNNLQVITSLLSLQSSFIEDEKTKGLFRYSQYRINSMAMVHEMLYQSDSLSKIDYNEYLHSLISKLIISFKGNDNNIKLEIDSGNVEINIDTAIPLGLLINEIITNSLKYGFKGRNNGKLTIKLKKEKNTNYILKIGDNGIGFSDETTFRNTSSLGLKLIHKLSLQLRGNIELDNSKEGTNYILHFHEIEQTS